MTRCKDPIERKDVVEILHEAMQNCSESEENLIGEIVCNVDLLPPAEPERKKGKWIIDDEFIDCSVCRHEKWSRVPYEGLVKGFRFCPNCGADMRGDQNDG